MFAFALYDKGREELLPRARPRRPEAALLPARERPLPVRLRDQGASSSATTSSARPNVAAIDGYLALRYVPQPETLFEGIRVLPGRHTLRLRLRGSELALRALLGGAARRPRPKTRSDAEHLAEFEALFLDAVRLTLRSDVPVGRLPLGRHRLEPGRGRHDALQRQDRDLLDRLRLARSTRPTRRPRWPQKLGTDPPRDPPPARALRAACRRRSGTSSGRSATR